MATELDALQLNFTASNLQAIGSIEKLQKTLRSLGDTLGLLSKTDDYSKNITSLSDSFGILNNAVSNVDNKKIKEVASSINSFVRASSKLSDFKGFGTISVGAANAQSSVQKLAEAFTKEFGITSEKSIGKVNTAIEELYKNIANSSAIDTAVEDIKRYVRSFSQASKEIKNNAGNWKEIRDYISGYGLKLPSNIASEWGDDFKNKRGILGIANTVTSGTGKGNAAELASELNSVFGTTFDISQSEADILNQIVSYLEQGREEGNNLVRSFWSMKENADGLNNSVGDLVGKLSEISNASAQGGETNVISEIADGLRQLTEVNVENLDSVRNTISSISKLVSGNVVKAGESLEKIAVGLRQFQGLDGILPKFEGMESFTSFLRGLGSKSVVAASGAIGQLATGLRQFEGLNINVNGLTELAQSLSMFGRKTAQSAITTIPQLATAFRGLITTLAGAPQVSSNVISLANALANFMANLRNVNGTSVQASRGLHLFGNTASRVSRKTFSLASAIGKLYATYFLLFRAFGKVKEAINISSDLKEVENVVNTTFGSMTDKVNEFAKTSIENFGLSELSAKQYASRFQAMGVAMGIPTQSIMKAQQQLNKINPTLAERGYSNVAESMADISLNITKLTADMASFYNVAQEDVAKDLESIWTGQTRPLRAYGLDLTNATLQEWAMKNGIDANVKSMSQAEKTLLRYQYVLANTSAAQGKLLVA